jgi:N-formylglutamate amidohydrolase
LDRYSGHLWIRVKATDSQGIATIRLLYDGHSIRNFDPFVEGKGYPKTVLAQIHWAGARHISLGKHTLEILAYDKLKNVSRTNISIVHLPEGSHHG